MKEECCSLLREKADDELHRARQKPEFLSSGSVHVRCGTHNQSCGLQVKYQCRWNVRCVDLTSAAGGIGQSPGPVAVLSARPSIGAWVKRVNTWTIDPPLDAAFSRVDLATSPKGPATVAVPTMPNPDSTA
jgi:hypothetical protein